MNTALYQVASPMVFRELTVRRWSHARHHSDTMVVGRDPEINVMRPADVPAVLRQAKDPTCFVRRELPRTAKPLDGTRAAAE